MMASEILSKLSECGVDLWVEGNQLRYRAPKGVLTESLRSSLAECKTEILDFLRHKSTENLLEPLPEIIPDRENRYQPFPLNDMQSAYHIGRSADFDLGNVSSHYYIEMEGTEVDLERLDRAFNQLINRHDMLRVVILPNGEQQILEKVPPYEIQVLDLRGYSLEEANLQLESVRSQMDCQVLPLDKCPLLEIRATLLSDRRTRLHISFDNIILDAWSSQLFLREWFQIYHNPQTLLEPLELSFRDYVLAELKLREGKLYKRSQEYWLNRLPTLPPAPELPVCRDRLNSLYKPRFVRRRSQLDERSWQQLKTKAMKAGLTPSGVVCAAFAEVLAVWSKNPQFTLVLTVFDRLPLHRQIDKVIGDFTKTILLEINSSIATFEARAKRIQQQLWEDLEHSQTSGVQVLRELARSQGSILETVMPIVFTSNLLNNNMRDNLDESPEILQEIYGISQTPQVLIDYQVSEKAGVLVFNWDCVDEVFPEGMLDDMFEAHCRHLQRLAESETAWQETQRKLVPPAQLTQRKTVNATAATISEDLLHELFEKQLKARSQHPAVIASSRQLTYSELADFARQISKLIRQKNIRPNQLVAIVMDKGWEQIAATLGILISGAAYVPIAPQLPQDRRWQLLKQASVKVVLTQSQLDRSLEWPSDICRISVDTLTPTASIFESESLESVAKPDDLAYVIYTSGSTGVPKGVAITHRGAVNTILDINQRFHVGSTDRVLALSSLSFDLSVYDIFGTLAAGGTIIVPDADRTKDPAHWYELVVQEQVTIWNSVPALMQLLVDYTSDRPHPIPHCLRLVLLSGDWLPLTLPERIKSLLPATQIISLGGATEASIWSIIYPIQEVEPHWKSIPYGQPMLNQQFHVLNEQFEPCPVWVPGQLYIGGIGLASCYWKEPEKTATSFMIHPVTGERLYKTGDLGRYLPDGNIEFLGREDFQVKVQGYRIELGEIEAAIEQYPKVRQATVIAVGERQQSKQLVACIASSQELASTPNELSDFISKKLPEYMVPSKFVFLDSLPLTPNGKVDRKALLNLASISAIPNSENDFAPPTTEIEEMLAEIWSEILGIEKVSIRDNFFALGGNSLLAIQLLTKVREAFQVDIPLRALIGVPAIADLSVVVENAMLQQIDTEIDSLTAEEARLLLEEND